MKGLLRIVGLFLPHFFAAALSCRKSTDKRLIKFFLPYGMMRRRMLDVFGEEVGSDVKDRGFSGLVRSVCPYGLVLWWDDDGKNVRPALVAARDAGGRPASVKVGTQGLESRLDALCAEMRESSERLELIVLRALTGRADARKAEMEP